MSKKIDISLIQLPSLLPSTHNVVHVYNRWICLCKYNIMYKTVLKDVKHNSNTYADIANCTFYGFASLNVFLLLEELLYSYTRKKGKATGTTAVSRVTTLS